MLSRSQIGVIITASTSCLLFEDCGQLDQSAEREGQRERSILEQRTWEIIGGDRSSSHPLSAEEYRSFAWIHPADSPSEVTCSGALVTPRHMLTAAHCLEPYQSSSRGLRFGVGVGLSPTGSSDRAFAKPQKAIQHPDLDLALVTLLDRPKLDLVTLPLVFEPLLDHESNIEAVGYGERGDPDQAAGRYFLALDQLEYDEQTQLLSVSPKHSGTGLCYGDSGGPLISLEPLARTVSARILLEDESLLGQQESEQRRSAIVGLESIGSRSCMGVERVQLISAQEAWLRATLDGAAESLEEFTTCRIGQVSCDGLRGYICPYGRPIIQDCPLDELCPPAREGLQSSFEQADLESLRTLDSECRRPLDERFLTSLGLERYLKSKLIVTHVSSGDREPIGPYVDPQMYEGGKLGGCTAHRSNRADSLEVLFLILGYILALWRVRRLQFFSIE